MSRLIWDMVEAEEKARLDAVKAGYEAELTKVRQDLAAAQAELELVSVRLEETERNAAVAWKVEVDAAAQRTQEAQAKTERLQAELAKVRQERDAALAELARLKIQRDTITERAWIMRRELLLAAEVLTGCGCGETAEECKRAAGEPIP